MKMRGLVAVSTAFLIISFNPVNLNAKGKNKAPKGGESGTGKTDRTFRNLRTLRVGFMYWYGPNLLQEHWNAVISGTVMETEKTETTEKGYSGQVISGKIKVHEVIHERNSKKTTLSRINYLKCTGGFDGIKKGDRVIVLLIKYEGHYAVPDFQNSTCRIGIRIDTFQDEIVSAVRRFAETGLIDKKDYHIWEKYDPDGLERRIEIQEMD